MPVEAKTPTTDADYTKVADAVRRMGDVGKKLAASGLTAKAQIILLHDATGVNKRDIQAILNALPNMPRWYTKP